MHKADIQNAIEIYEQADWELEFGTIDAPYDRIRDP